MGASLQGSGGGRGRGLRRRSGYRPMAEINVTPMVDVMLVLLVIFMVTAPLLTVGVRVDLPKTSAGPVSGSDEPVAITVRQDGGVFIQDTEIELAGLANKLRAVTQNNPEVRIFVRGDKAVDYGRVMQVMGAINAAGYLKVALITNKAEDGEGEGR
ncbi:MAG: protein TolR [Magnetospiraceae bacterium]